MSQNNQKREWNLLFTLFFLNIMRKSMFFLLKNFGNSKNERIFAPALREKLL